jgi:cytochrome c6
MKTSTHPVKYLIERLLAIALLALLTLPTPALAANLPANLPADLPSGAKVFEVHCAGCHINGGNIVRRGKNLKLKTLQKNHMDSIAAIAEIVTNGKNNMSAYRDRLTDPQIQEVSAYVLEQAQQNWK